jgi:uncharacterized protein (DUF305 family)
MSLESKSFRAVLVALAVVLAGTVLAACGGDEATVEAGGETAASQGNETDQAFIAGMVPHHDGAIEMAEIARERGESDFVRELAEDIIESQGEEIATMRAVKQDLDAAGVTEGDLGVPEHEMGMDMDVGMLRTTPQFDRDFIDMMVPHHQGAIRMARVELARGGDERLTTLATEIIEAQEREIVAMNEHREQEFGAASPAGGVPPEGEAAPADEAGEEHGGGHGG